MGQWFDIALQCGKTVAKEVDKVIEANVENENCLKVKEKKELKDGSTVYVWYMKWAPYVHPSEKQLVETLRKFSDEEEDEDKAYKLVAIGDEGGQDSESNNIGNEIFDGLYGNNTIVLPDEYCDNVDQESIDRGREIMEVAMACSSEKSAEIMAGLLMDDNVSTYEMFEDLVSAYHSNGSEFRKGMNRALAIITQYDLKEISEMIAEAMSVSAR